MNKFERIKGKIIIPHKNSCGKTIFDKDGHAVIDCGCDLGGDNDEFAQCVFCREKDTKEFMEKHYGK